MSDRVISGIQQNVGALEYFVIISTFNNKQIWTNEMYFDCL